MEATEKQKAKRYSLTERMDALAVLRQNGYNFTKTSRMINVSQPSLRLWHKKYGKQMEEVSKTTEAIMVNSSEKIQEYEKDFIAEVYDTKLLIVRRVRELIPTAKSIRILSDALAVLHSMEAKEAPQQDSNVLHGQYRDFVLNLVSNQIAVVTPEGKITRQNKFIESKRNDHAEN